MAEPAPTSSSERPFGKNAVYATISAASAALLLLFQAIVSHVLGEEVFGRFTWALTFGMFGEALMDLGVHQVTIRTIARDPTQTRHLFRNSLTLKAFSGAAMFIMMAAVSSALAPDPEILNASLIMLGVSVLRSYILTIRGVLQGLERFGRDCLVVVGDRVLVLIVTSAAVVQGAGLIGVTIAFAMARVLALGVSLAIVHADAGRPGFSFDLALWRRLQREALPIGVFLVVLNVYSYIDSIMLGVLSTFTDTGLYANAYRLYEGLHYAPGVMSALLTPRLASLWKADQIRHLRMARRSLAAALALAVLVAAPTSMLARPLLVTVFGAPAEAAVTTLNILLAGVAPVFLIWILHAIALSVFKERLLLSTTCIGAIVNASLNLWLIPRYGRDGAAFATVVGETLTLMLLLWGLRSVLWPRMERA